MKRIFYGIGFFTAVFFLSAEFIISYQIADLKDRMQGLEEDVMIQAREASAAAEQRPTDYIFERYDEEAKKIKKEQFKVQSYSGTCVVLREDRVQESKEAGYDLKAKEGYVVVYYKDTDIVYEYTNIPVSALPGAVQAEIFTGKILRTDAELYGFLENYSS